MKGSLSRRSVLSAGMGGALCLGLGHRSAAAEGQHWGYEGAEGPENWGGLAEEFQACSTGLMQAPIDLDGAVPRPLAPVATVWSAGPVRVANNGHTIQVDCAPGATSLIEGQRYGLVQFHFHHPSEHTLSGRAFPLECHFVHAAPSGALAVLGVFIEEGAENPALAPIWEVLPREPGTAADPASPFDPTALLPAGRGFFRYDGSLTTPPCSEGPLWTVFRQPIAASPAQIARFAALFPLNARPVQPLNGRDLWESA